MPMARSLAIKTRLKTSAKLMAKNNFWSGFEKRANVVHEGVKTFSKRVHRGLRSETVRSGGMDSLAAWPLIEGAKKVFGPKKTYKALHKIHEKALNADMVAGRIPHKIMQKMPFGKKLFVQKDQVPYGKGHLKEVERTSLLAPLVKVRDVAAPIALGVESEKVLKKFRKDDESGTS